MKKSWQIVLHILFWVGIETFLIYVSHDESKLGMSSLLIIFGVYGIINIGLFYLNYLYLIPRFLDKKRYRDYTIALLIAIVVFAVGKYFLTLSLHSRIEAHQNGKVPSFLAYFLGSSLTNVLFLFLSTALKFSIDWFLNARVQRDLENQRLMAELAFLKSQINPHFLFNSLNSIYSLAYQKSDTAPEAILKLSEIMRYMLYESNDTKVDLAKELQYLQNYIDLQKIRFGNKAFVEFKVTGEVGNQQIVPLLLIAFIENAFKHGVANDPNMPIRLFINLDGANLHFYTENKKHMNNRDIEGGVGLQNVQRRLELLYPGHYKLDIQDKPDTYICELSLVL
ncbi:MAG TPA: sensor histidine kinase [Mucilaginibacter sp.]|jgi:two-component sensor histidine kinase|nr:sensor histidine kinase [Mucilaginibacter sp.]